MMFQSLWCRRVRCLHLILDNGSTHAPRQLPGWIKSLKLAFEVRLHWLPVHASWLDQIEIVFSQVQKKVLTPNHYDSVRDLERTLMAHFAQRNKRPVPIRWSYTEKLLQQRRQKVSLKLAA